MEYSHDNWYRKRGQVNIRMWPFQTEYQLWTQSMWSKLGRSGQDGTLYQALIDTTLELTNCPNAADNMMLRGQGSWYDLKLSNW